MQQEVPQLRFATTRLASGLRLHYAEQGDPGGEPIVFLPGYTDSWFSYSRVLPLLPARYHAYALDQRGHGDSERPDCCYAVEDFAADVVAFLDAVAAERATLVGHSGSCLVARRVAEAHPERVARLVLLGAPQSLGDNQEELELQTAVRALEDPVPVQFARELQGAAAHVPLPEPFFEGLVAESLKLPARVWKATLEGLFAFDDAGVGPLAAARGGGPPWGGHPRGQGGGVPGDRPQPQLGAPGAGRRRPGRLHARDLAGLPAERGKTNVAARRRRSWSRGSPGRSGRSGTGPAFVGVHRGGRLPAAGVHNAASPVRPRGSLCPRAGPSGTSATGRRLG
jgi:non-heme chloroperoxidase